MAARIVVPGYLRKCPSGLVASITASSYRSGVPGQVQWMLAGRRLNLFQARAWSGRSLGGARV